MTKPLICDLPYPTLNDIVPDIRCGQIVSFAYATQSGELNAILQYLYHSQIFRPTNAECCDIMRQIAMAEMIHLQILGELMFRLGVNPIYRQIPKTPNVWYNTARVAYSTTHNKMILDNIEGELTAIADYKKMLFILKNEQVEAVIQRIVLDEELHLEKLKPLLNTTTY